MILAIALAVTLQDIGWLAGDWQLTTGAQCTDRLKKVIDRRNGDGNLTARIEGEAGGRAFSEDYAYSRRAAGARRCGL